MSITGDSSRSLGTFEKLTKDVAQTTEVPSIRKSKHRRLTDETDRFHDLNCNQKGENSCDDLVRGRNDVVEKESKPSTFKGEEEIATSNMKKKKKRIR